MTEFTHPLARGAKIWEAKLRSGETRKILVVITNVELNPRKKRFNSDNVDRLTVAVEEFLEDNRDIDGYVFASRLRDWENSRDR